jgi:cytochrome c5
MQRIHTKRLAWLLCLGVLSAGCEEWWGEEGDDPELDAALNPSTSSDAAVDAAAPAADAGLPLADAAPALDGAVITADAAVDANPALDAAPSIDTGLLDAAPDAAAEAGADAAVADAAAPDAAADAAPPAPATEVPCDVAQVLKTRCQSCHGDPPVGAPIKLVTLADLRAPAAAGGFVYQRIQVRVDGNTMPPSWATTGALSNTEKATLTSWISAGAPGSSATCP